MSLPKEPRQQMINMMYLVLIALLAMNVSAEILKAFRLVQLSLDKSNKAAIAKVDDLYGQFEFNMKNDPEKTREFYKRAKLVKQYSAELFDFIGQIKAKLEKLGSGEGKSGEEAYQDHGHGVTELAEASNQDFSGQVFVLERQGDKLQDLINLTRERMLTIIDDNERETFSQTFALERAEKPKSDEGSNRSWAASTFESMPLAAVVTLLSKYESDVKAAEIDILSYLLSKIGAEDIRFDVLESQVIPQSSYVTLGEDYKAKIFVSAYSSTQIPSIFIGQLNKDIVGAAEPGTKLSPVLVDPMTKIQDTLRVESGKGEYKVSPNGIGPQAYEGAIRLKKPDGNYIYFPFIEEYTVGKGGVVVSPDKMNVFYIGVDNPVSISVPGFAPDKVKASVSQGSLSPGSGKGRYIVRVNKTGEAIVNVSVVTPDGNGVKSMGKAPFRVKRVPDPVAKVGTLPSGNVPTATFKAQRGVVADLENFDFDIKFNVLSYELIYQAPRQDLIIVTGNGPIFDSKMLALLSRAKPGDSFVLNEIKVKGPDGSTRKLPSVAYRLK